jgi:diguanylate cyclase (GGDEF)-like protein
VPNPDPNTTLPQRIPILIAEDSAVIQTVLRNMLTHWGYDVVQADDGLNAWKILESDNAPRLAIVDWMMPGLHGPDLCRRIRAAAREPYTYVLLLTSRSDATDIVEGLDAGADDYLTKPFHAQELRARVRAGRRIVKLQEQLLSAREALRDRATFDPLTRLYNRPSILEVLDREMARTDRESLPLSVILADVDRFRQVNDSFGPMAGDLVLRECANRIRAVAPSPASAGRYAGEEFLVVLPGTSRIAAQAIASKIRASIGSEPFAAGAASFPVTCSVGAAGRELPYTSDALSLLRDAHESLAAAKIEARERLAETLRASAASFAGDPNFRRDLRKIRERTLPA